MSIYARRVAGTGGMIRMFFLLFQNWKKMDHSFDMDQSFDVEGFDESMCLEKDVKLYDCTHCGYRSRWSASVRRHTKLKHQTRKDVLQLSRFCAHGGYFSWFGPELFCLLLGPPGFNCWFSSAPMFQWCVRHPRDLQVSVATRFCRVLIFASS